ncbi:MAG TPA: Coenzyme F420 hydrogenase/dehydrogenase, beta subunit C-terminal domain [Candidatus Lokiarchaeia archaeon]|nr:Coenzyme F420 hydrogenase/dehydrogenase, beta subunit C-terminal domain [Candidatus Lokiarchaeia archaeon]
MDTIVANNIEIAKQKLQTKFKTTFTLLRKKIIDTNVCIRCGKCVALCDAIGWGTDGKPTLVGKCIACGLCYYQCPKSPGSPLGDFKTAYITRSKLAGVEGQNGATVTTLLTDMLENGDVEAAIVTRQDPEKPWTPKPYIARDAVEIQASAGTIYAHSPVVPLLVDAVNEGLRKIAIVATPCKISAIKELLNDESGVLKGIEGLSIFIIGLFCSESFDTERLLDQVSSKVDVSAVTKMAISHGMLWVHTKDGKESFPLSAITQDFVCTSKSCEACADFSAEQADISIGSVGTDSKHNTVLVRSDAGQAALDGAVERGKIESRQATKDELKPVIELAWKKKERGVMAEEAPALPGKFREHDPESWNVDNFEYTPELHPELYTRVDYKEQVINSNPGGSKILVARVPDGTKQEMTTYNYSTAYDLTYNLLKDFSKLQGGKVFVKPNNTGFVGIFKHNPKLDHILKDNDITDDADHQPIATQPSTLQGIVDALLDLGAAKIHIGENMLWDGGTPRAFYETGYAELFSKEKYKDKVFFIDYCENDPPASDYRKIAIKTGKYDVGDYYTHFYSPRAFFEEKYDLIYIAAIAKCHNCTLYSLMTKDFSVSLNPRKKTGKIEPRWHIHGLPTEVFRKAYLEKLFGKDFHRKYQYLLRETYPHEWDANLKEKIVKPDKSRVLLTGRLTTQIGKTIPATFHSSGLMKWYKSYGKRVLNVDPHHWAGINLLPAVLGMGYLVSRYIGIYAGMVDALKENGTEVAGLVTGITGQERDGPLIYGNSKYSGFAVAGFDAAAVDKVCLDIMFGDDGDFQKAIIDFQASLMERFGIKNDALLDEARRMWSLELLSAITGGTIDNEQIDLTMLDYSKENDLDGLKPSELYKIRLGKPYVFSESLYCSPNTWLMLIHTDDDVFRNAFWYTIKTIEIPLIPDVVG